jgi:ribosome-interacting GTPase 1
MTKPTGSDDHRKRVRLKWLKRRWRRVRIRGGSAGEKPMPMSHKDLWVKIKRESKGKSPRDELRLLEDYLSDWPEYKGPYQDLRKKLERRVAELRKVTRVLASHGGHTDPFSVRKRGLAEIALVGLPNVGKTSVFRALTGADADVADYPYTTLTPNVGMFTPGGFEFEVVDLPPFPEGSLEEVHYASGLKEACLNATLLCAVVDLTADPELQLDTLRRELSEMGAGEPVALVGTHADDAGSDEVEALRGLSTGAPVLTFPLGEGEERAVAEALCGLIGRIVVDARDPVSKEEPLAYAIPEGATVVDLALQIHKDLASKARKARVWGPSASFEGQEVGLDHALLSGDLVEILTK